MDLARLFVRGGVRSFKKKFEDGSEETFFYTSRTPAETAGFRGAYRSFKDDEAGGMARDAYMGKFLVASLCDEVGQRVLTEVDARRIPEVMKTELCMLVVLGSEETGDAGKD